MAKKKQPEAALEKAPTPPKHEALESWGDILDAIPKGKIGAVFGAANCVEVYLRRGIRALAILDGVRRYILDTDRPVHLGGENSPFVQEIDKILPREEAK